MEKTKAFEQRLEAIFGKISEKADHIAAIADVSQDIEDHWDYFNASTNLDHPKVLPVQVANMRFAFLSGAFSATKIQHTLALLDTEEAFIEGTRVSNERIARALVEQMTALETAVKDFMEEKPGTTSQGNLQ